MSIRLKQLLLLLAIALVPVALSAWNSLRQVDAMTQAVAASARQEILQRDRHYMAEKVTDIGRNLALTAQSAENYLRQQQLLVELALSRDAESGNDFLLSADVPTAPEAIEETRFRREHPGFASSHIKISLLRPSFLLAPGASNAESESSIRKLAAIGEDLQAIYQESRDFALWHYAALANGVAMVYPGHGEYPAGYDPRQRHWYKAAIRAKATIWLPLTIDASTGQPVLTVATAIRSPDGGVVGATAFDLPLQNLLHFHSIAQPWLNDARLALLQANGAQSLGVAAMKAPLQLNSDWTSDPQTHALEGLSPQHHARIRALKRGESTLLESVILDQRESMLAVTSLSDAADSWLALASPASAIEASVQSALAELEQQRSATLEQHIIAACALAALVALIALYAAQKITAPLIAMSQTTEAIAAGKLHSRTGLQGADEVGQLSRSIDHMADSIEHLMQEQEDAYRGMVTTLTRALEKKDSYTAAHSGRVTRYSLKLGAHIGLDDDTLEKLRFGALTHDLGKIGIADKVLNKPAPLDDDEYDIMKQHPAFSKTIMKPLVRFREYADIAGSHHEHWNGKGYPEGLAGEDIPLLARIVAIADAWDAMTGDRVYRKGMPVEKALSILEREKDDGQFDPTLIRAFIELVRTEYNLA